jgi:hypothetical protein
MPDPIRQPRKRDEKYLAWIRTLPCVICGDPRSEAAHLRIASINDDKRETGMGEKPSDRWVLPLCRLHHSRQHSMNEAEFWASYGIDPFALALRYHMPRGK